LTDMHIDVSTEDNSATDEYTFVAQLVHAYKPGFRIAALERMAGLDPGALKQHLKPSTARKRMPPHEVIERFAKAIGAPLWEVSRAFAADRGIPLDQPPPDPLELELVVAFRTLPDALKEATKTMVCALAHSHQVDPPDCRTA
jgi:hypothetical protein